MNKFLQLFILKSILIVGLLSCSYLSVYSQVSVHHFESKIKKLDFSIDKTESQKSLKSLQSIIVKRNKDYSSSFFCNVEAQIEKQTKFLVRFRLGTVDYVDRMEGKITY